MCAWLLLIVVVTRSKEIAKNEKPTAGLKPVVGFLKFLSEYSQNVLELNIKMYLHQRLRPVCRSTYNNKDNNMDTWFFS